MYVGDRWIPPMATPEEVASVTDALRPLGRRHSLPTEALAEALADFAAGFRGGPAGRMESQLRPALAECRRDIVAAGHSPRFWDAAMRSAVETLGAIADAEPLGSY